MERGGHFYKAHMTYLEVPFMAAYKRDRLK